MRKEPPANSVKLDMDEMGPVAAKSYPGQEAVHVQARPAEGAKQEIDCRQRAKGYVYGADVGKRPEPDGRSGFEMSSA